MKMQTTSAPFVIVALLCVLLPKAQAVSPAPDGGYPGGNTAEGQAALLSLTTGGFNTAVGIFSLESITTGQFNTGVGAGTLLVNTADKNTATGAGALLSNTAGSLNTANGAFALFFNTTGNANTADGYGALHSNTIGSGNTATGFDALVSNTTGNGNTALGEQALLENTTGVGNTAVGNQALYNNTTGSYNVALNGGHNLTTGIFNIDIANDGIADESNTTRIGILQNRCFISGIREVTTGNADAIPVLIDSAGQLGTVSSSRRFKKEIKPMDKASEAILALRPVTFHYKTDKTDTPQFGLIAEEVAEVNPDLVVRDKDGEIYTVRYDTVNAMMLNEFLKEHRTVEEQEVTITQLKTELQATAARLQKQVDALTAGLQRVSEQFEMHKPAPQTVLNNR